MSTAARRESVGQATRRGRRLRRVGLWDAEPWLPQSGTTDAVKRFTWAADAVALTTSERLVLRYFTEAHAAAAELEDPTMLAKREAAARELLERAVANALEGIGYVPTPRTVDSYIHPAVVECVGAWGELDDFPDDRSEQLADAIRAGQQQYREAVAWTQRLCAAPDPDPALGQFGWRAGIRPLASEGATT